MKKYIVYKHTNKINGKVYIGKTCQDPEVRYGSNGIGYRFCPYFYNAIIKYGWENFDHEILFADLSAEEANEKEIICIKQYNACDPEYGYNIRGGGNGFDSESSLALWEDEEYVQKIRQANLQHWQDENFRENMIQCMKDAWKDPEKRERRSNITKERWSNKEFHKKAQQAVLEACRKSVKCIETDEVFQSIAEAGNKYNICQANISRACKTGYRCGGYHWIYNTDNTL